MKIKVYELQNRALDWAVAKAIGEYKPVEVPNYSTSWEQGGPIIEREHINISAYQLPEEGWQAWPNYGMSDWYTDGPTPLIAAMRCYVASKLGDEVEVPSDFKHF